MHVQPQAQLIKDLSHIVLMLSSNTVSNHKEGLIPDLDPDSEFQTDILKFGYISVSALA